MTSDLNKSQTTYLKKISKIDSGLELVPRGGVDMRTVNALVRRDFVKLFTKKSHHVAKITPKGKKYLN